MSRQSPDMIGAFDVAVLLQSATTMSAQPTCSGIKGHCPFTISCARRRGIRRPFMAFFSSIDDREKNIMNGTSMAFCCYCARRRQTNHSFFPFYSRARSPGTNVPPNATVTTQESDFYLWPLYTYKRFHSAPADRSRKRILFFLYSDTIQKKYRDRRLSTAQGLLAVLHA